MPSKTLLKTLEDYNISSYMIAVHALGKHFSATSRIKKAINGYGVMTYVDVEKICAFLKQHTGKEYKPEDFIKEVVKVRV